MGKPDSKDPSSEPPNPKYSETSTSRSGYYDHSSAKKWVRPTGEPQSAKVNVTLFDPKKKYEVPITDNRYNRARERVLASTLFSRFDGDWADSPFGWVVTMVVWIVMFLPFILFGLFILAFFLYGVLMYFHNG